MKKIYAKLFEIQQNLKASKSQYNKFGGYNYRNCEDILVALKPLLAQTNTTLLIEDYIEQIGDRYYVKAIVKLIDLESDETITNQAYAREEESKKGMDGSQVTGASSSYARKYALNGMFAIDDTKDSDATNKHGKDNQNENEDGLKIKLEKYLMYLCDNNTNRFENALVHYTKFTTKDGKEVAGVTDIDKLSQARLKATYGKVKADYLKKGGKEDA